MERGMMSMAATGEGRRRLASAGAIAIVAFATLSTAAASQATRPVAGRTTDTSFRGDAPRVSELRPPLIILLKRIDSLAQLQDSMKIGSPEYVRADEELSTLIHSLLPATSDGRVTITLGPRSAEQMSRAPFAARANMDVEPRGWIGMFADGLHEDWVESDGHYYRYFVYPIVVTVDANSPAARVGVQFGDSLVAFNGMDLRRNVINLTRLIEPGRTLKLTLRRDGETKDVSIVPDKIPPNVLRDRRASEVARMLVPSRAPMVAMAGDSTGDWRIVEKLAAVGGRGFGMTRTSKVPMPTMMIINGLLGAHMTDLDSSGVFSLTREKASHGVLVTEVPVGSKAARMGLRSADMIVAIDDADVTSLAQLHRELMSRGPNKSTQFVVVRAGKIEKLTYEPR
jgi:membrane-associated protease RseP (regulator of RpoE activity)